MRLELFGVVILVVFTVFVTAFAAAADKTAVRALPKALWVLLCLLVSPIGGILYLTLGRPLPSETQNTDDPSYLRRLADRLRENNNDN